MSLFWPAATNDDALTRKLSEQRDWPRYWAGMLGETALLLLQAAKSSAYSEHSVYEHARLAAHFGNLALDRAEP